MDRSADPIDRASEVTDELTQDCIDRYRRLAAPEQQRELDGSWPHPDCVDCEEPIEPERLEAGRVRCFTCQSLLEKRNKQYAR